METPFRNNGYYIIDDFFHKLQDSLPELFLLLYVEKQLKKAAVYDILLMIISKNNETAKWKYRRRTVTKK